MYDLDGTDTENEFVEIYNTSTSTTYDLTNWSISDKSSTDVLTDFGYGLVLQPLSYAVIMDDDYDIATGSYNSIIPPGALIVNGGSAIGNGLSNSDSLYLKDNTDALIDSYGWTDIAPDGYSLERIRMDQPSTVDNWKASKDSLGTPGGKNSVAPLSIDGAIDGTITFTPANPDRNDNVTAIVPVENVGLNDISGTLTATVNNKNIGTKTVATLSSNESKDYYLSLSTLPSGRHNVVFEFEVDSDGDITNNAATKKLGISYEPGAIQINEFMAEPGVDQIEFIELVASRSIVIDAWTISDKSTVRQLPITYLEKDDYIVLASDTSLKSVSNPQAKYLIPYSGLPTLNNSGDNIYLKDMNHTIIDSLAYGSGWPVVADSSIEKLRPNFDSNDPINWKTSGDPMGMTPGFINSRYLIDYDGEIITDSITRTPQFPKNDEPILLNIPVTNHGAESISGSLNIYDDDNSLIESYAVSNIARRDTVVFVYYLQPMASGIHPMQIVLEIADDGSSEDNIVSDTILVSYSFGDVLMNEFLARPNSTQAEFVELVTFKDVDMINWSIEDATNNRKYFDGGEIISDKYIVLSEDLAFHPIIPSEALFIEVDDFPSLNNYGDAIYLRDFTGSVIDSLTYTTWWELETGKSTEKIYPDLTSNDSTIWKISIDSTGMTPGAPNSVVAKNIDGAILHELIVISPEFPNCDDEIRLTIPVTNIGLQAISGELNLRNDNTILSSIDIDNLAADDTLFYDVDIQSLHSGVQEVDIQLNIDNDGNIDNNSVLYELMISYEFGAVMLNEFLADPEAPQYEFVEFFTSQQVDLFNWSIADRRGDKVHFGKSSVGQNNIVLLAEEPLNSDLSDNALYFEISDFPSLNNSGDGIYLYDFSGKVIDSLIYDNTAWPIESGRSAEKIFPDYISNDASNWQLSTDPNGTTMGNQNSVLLNSIDGKIIIELVSHYPEYPHPSESIAFELGMQNCGIENISGQVIVYQNGTELGIGTFDELSSGDTTHVTFNINPLSSGNNLLDIALTVTNDMNLTNNHILYSIYVSYPFGAVVLNEFLADPDSTQAEFVEIIAFSDVDFSGWSISDNTFKQYYFDEVFALANQPIVVTNDSLFAAMLSSETPIIFINSGWPTLNNDADGIFLFDPTNTVIDSLNYNSDWPMLEARSTEKYRPDFESF